MRRTADSLVVEPSEAAYPNTFPDYLTVIAQVRLGYRTTE